MSFLQFKHFAFVPMHERHHDIEPNVPLHVPIRSGVPKNKVNLGTLGIVKRPSPFVKKALDL